MLMMMILKMEERVGKHLLCGVDVTNLQIFTFFLNTSHRFFHFLETATQDNETINSVAKQGAYDIKTVDGEQVARVGPQFPALLHEATCRPSVDECDKFEVSFGVNTTAEELSIRWGTCVEGVVQLGVSAEPDDRASTYDLEWPEDGVDSLRGQSVRSKARSDTLYIVFCY
jgi:hypothetical protein